MKKKNGFTLIELLAVIVIMGILMLVAIPSISRVIENSRKDTFVDIAKSYVGAAKTLWTADALTCEGRISSSVDDGDYYILINTKDSAREHLPVLLDQGGKSSWGNRNVSGYVRVNVKTTDGEDTNGDGKYEVEPKRTVKFYVALSDGTHGLIDDNTKVSDNLVRGDIDMALSDEDLKKIELTVDDGKLDCARSEDGIYSCTEVTPIRNITGVCVDDNTSVGVTGNVGETGGGGAILGMNFATDDWNTIISAIRSGTHPYSVGDTKEVDMGSFGTHTLRISNLSTPSECSGTDFSQTACGVVLEFVDILATYQMNSFGINSGGWPLTDVRTYVNNDVYNNLPSELQSAIVDTKVVSGSNSRDEIFVSSDKIYGLSPTDIFGGSDSYDKARELTRQLDYYKNIGITLDNYSGTIKQYNNINQNWWLRTAAHVVTPTKFYSVNDTGKLTASDAADEIGVSPAFRIG